MPKLTSFMICDAINNMPIKQADGKINNVPALFAPVQALRPQFVPGNFSFGIAVGISDIDLNVSNKMLIRIKNPNDKIVHDSGIKEIPPAPHIDNKLPKEYQGFIMCIDIRNLSIDVEGIYIFELFLNDELMEKKEIPIFGQ